MLVMLSLSYYYIDVSVAFSTNSRFVEEGIGQVELTLTLDGPIDCCSVSVAVKFEDGTAKGIDIHTYMHNILPIYNTID